MSDPRTTPSIFTRGAVDLSALRPSAPARPAAPTRPAAPAGEAPGAAPSGIPGVTPETVIEVNEADFQSVLELSVTTPILLDFWADWCEPCKQLSPVLERLAEEYAGAWILGKVNVDVNPRLAQVFRVQGIPQVTAVIGGQPVEGFSGVLSETQIRQYIDAVLKAAGVSVAVPEDPRLDEADDALMGGDLDAAEAAYRKILAESPADAAAESGLAQVELYRRISGVDPAAALAKADADPSDVAAQRLAADIEVLSGTADLAYQRLVALVKKTSGEDREAVRKHLLSLFSVAGPDDPAVAGARRALASALF
ncbi:MAG TPA: tetratricopeptide repeat protein [Actinoplanes sp.]|nr:tetratricopeptide repeat protein [Actinoplanes sp.]